MESQARRQWVQAAVAAVGLGLLLGGAWAARGMQQANEWFLLPAGRAVAVVLLVACALAFSSRKLGRTQLLAVAASAFAGHAACLLLLRFGALDAPETSALAFASFLLDGLFLAAAILCFLRQLTALSERHARIGLGAGLAVATAYDLIAIQLGPDAATLQWVLSGAVALALCFLCRAPGGSAAASDGEPPQEDAASGEAEQPAPAQQGPWALALGLVALLMLVQGAVVQATGYGGAGVAGGFGSAGDIISLVTRGAVLGYCVLAIRAPRPVPTAAALACVWCLALAGVAVEALSGQGSIGNLALEAGYNVAQAAALLLACDFAQRYPTRELPALCLGAAAMLANQVTRLAGMAAFGPVPGAPEFAAGAACVGAGVVGVAACVLLWVAGVRHRSENRAVAAESEGADGTSPEEEAPTTDETPDAGANPEEISPFVAQALQFARRFDGACALAGLTPREREVLFYAVHGYTIDNIAEKLVVSRETVKSNLARAYARAGVSGKQGFLALIDQAQE